MINRQIEAITKDGTLYFRVPDLKAKTGYDLRYAMSKLGIEPLVLDGDLKKTQWATLDTLNKVVQTIEFGTTKQRKYASRLKPVIESLTDPQNYQLVDYEDNAAEEPVQELIVEEALDDTVDNVISLSQVLFNDENAVLPIEFENNSFGRIRVVLIDGEPWFVGVDVAAALGYANKRDALLTHVDFDDRRNGVAIRDSLGRTQKCTAINESAVYSLTFGSQLPTAKEFKKWVTSEVLPSIRERGYYANLEAAWAQLTSPDSMIKIATQWKEDRERRIELEAKVEEDKPKVQFAETVADSKGAISVSELSKLIYDKHGINIGRNRLYAWLRSKGILTYQDNLPYQRYMQKGWFVLTEKCIPETDSVYIQLRITGAGQVALVDKIVSDFATEAVSSV